MKICDNDFLDTFIFTILDCEKNPHNSAFPSMPDYARPRRESLSYKFIELVQRGFVSDPCFKI